MKSFFQNNKLQNLAFFMIFSSSFLFAQKTHTVQKGDTLYSISKKYNTTLEKLTSLNKIEGTGIKIGQVLIIEEKSPSNQKTQTLSENSFVEYKVQKGQTWYGIARENKISLSDLYKINGTDGSKGLKAGDTIKIPKYQTQTSSKNKSSKDNSNSKITENQNNKTSENELKIPPITENKKYGKKGDSSLIWPVKKCEVYYIEGKVSGVCLVSKSNEDVTAIKSGTVMFSGAYRGFGNVVFIQSKTGHIYAYTGLSKVVVSKGDYVDYTNKIGTVGIDSYTQNPQISLMVFQNGLPIDPAKAPRG